jgi:hypothetical protein
MSAESGEKSKFLEGAKNFAIGVGIVALSIVAGEVVLFNLGAHMLAGV